MDETLPNKLLVLVLPQVGFDGSQFLKAVFLQRVMRFIVYYVVNYSSVCEVLIVNNILVLYI